MTKLLQDWLRSQAEQRPEATALVQQDRRLSYGEAERISNQFANMLRSAGCQDGDRVCLLLPKSLDAILAIHGTLKAGCIYVPLDVESPPERLAHVFETSRPRAVLA